LFPVFPVLFPVCSQIPANAFNVFPTFSVPDARAISAVFCIPFSQPGNTGNNGNSNRDRRCCASSTVEQWWNDWEQIRVRTYRAFGPYCRIRDGDDTIEAISMVPTL
jgi:hypothetical protein